MPKKKRKKKVSGQQKKYVLIGVGVLLVVILPIYFIFFRGALTFALDPKLACWSFWIPASLARVAQYL